MNHYSYCDIFEGLSDSFTIKITSEMLKVFRDLSGDINPLHNDDRFAEKYGYREKVCYGLLTSSFLSTLAGVYLPGEKSLIREVNVKFHRPVYVDDELTIIGEVAEVYDNFEAFLMKVKIVNQKDEKVLSGKMMMGILKES